MPRSTKVEALILSRRQVGEADRMLRCITREFGLIKLNAKGVRRIPSRRGGHVEPFTKVSAVIRGDFLGAVETLNYYPNLRADKYALQQMQIVNQLILNVLPEDESQPVLYQRLAKTWQVLPKVASRSRWLLEAGLVTTVLQIGGIFPALTACTQCGVRQPREAVLLDARHGGWHCLSCHGGWEGATHSLSGEALSLLQVFATQPQAVFRRPVSEDTALHIVNALRIYVAQVIERPVPLLQPSLMSSYVTV